MKCLLFPLTGSAAAFAAASHIAIGRGFVDVALALIALALFAAAWAVQELIRPR